MARTLCLQSRRHDFHTPDQGTRISCTDAEVDPKKKKGKIQYEAIYRMNGKIAGREDRSMVVWTVGRAEELTSQRSTWEFWR